MYFRLTLVLLLVTLLTLLASLSLRFVGVANASGHCQVPYTVQYGDTLDSIARRFNISEEELINLNGGRYRNPYHLLARQVLCLPGHYSEPPLANSQVVIEVTYQYTPNAAESEWQFARGGRIGKRVIYPLQPINAIDTVSTTQEIAVAVKTALPVLGGVRNNDQANTYTLVTVGRQDILSSLRLSGTVPYRSRCLAPSKVEDALGDKDVKEVTVTLWLEGDSGLRYPFLITHVDSLPNARLLWDCYTEAGKEMGFALFPADSGRSGEYRTLMVLSQEGFGPPGRGWYARCSAWYGGWFHRWLRAWYGCAGRRR
jgi:LysM repeat protein